MRNLTDAQKAERYDQLCRELEGMTIGGSEFVNDPFACVRFIRDKIRMQTKRSDAVGTKFREARDGRDELLKAARMVLRSQEPPNGHDDRDAEFVAGLRMLRAEIAKVDSDAGEER